MYNRKGFKMLGALNEHCCPDSVANTFTTRMSLINDSMGESEGIMAFQSPFNSMVNDMAHCNTVIPLIIMVMLFLRSLPPATMTFLKSFAPSTNPSKAHPLILLRLRFVIRMSSNLLGWIGNCPLARTFGLQLPLLLLGLIGRAKSETTPMSGYPSSILTV